MTPELQAVVEDVALEPHEPVLEEATPNSAHPDESRDPS
jgi:hypothetical protein